MERGLSGLLIKKGAILMVKSKQPFSRYGKKMFFFLAIFPPEQLEVLNSLRANNYLSQTVLDFQKINKNNRMI